MSEPEQLDIFIPLQRSHRFREWALLAREHEMDLGRPEGIPAFAEWLRESGRAPSGVSEAALQVLVAVMKDYEAAALHF